MSVKCRNGGDLLRVCHEIESLIDAMLKIQTLLNERGPVPPKIQEDIKILLDWMTWEHYEEIK